jgi:hypothetical protein
MQIVRAETEFNHGHPVPTELPEQEFGHMDPPAPVSGWRSMSLAGRRLPSSGGSLERPASGISSKVSSPAAQASRRTNTEAG